MLKEEILASVGKAGIIAVIRANSISRSIEVAQACIKGGVKGIELTYTVPEAAKAIKLLLETNSEHSDVLIGAGTILTAFDANEAINAGAEYIVSPTFDEQVALTCNARNINYFPGCFTPAEVYHAKKYGIGLVKVFPASVVGPGMIRELHGPFPDTRIMPTGGINLSNITDWLEAGAYAVGIGGSLVGNNETSLDTITHNAEQFIKKIQGWHKMITEGD
ncbi:keto-hydroxyglutarate-aldolase keto-deoxy-phosphogluconate aldolase [Lapidilactobacillus concavus DSM 17758]|jgi:2-dehydro-3-deoxyphosphogluconate aldolase/(4S)-4-hydroxy-2-oxoglutarate aldolase|uniref:Keto-hydroxyglutarate-aldolase keto-deoxy-phosphogluconate aldolase n=1 Tax=Lapidilactobacillus concavus DSM 17758 TaxID=1423735 RepID=A0A0R1W7H2_9LACO|nr:bifunctional 2-keto-4-hydroxyglutarate aldolase/2-keto-3-deoxy-6-phosphogluconate aldolase [Lapidilactobacillus concavus]KRM13864.1 keto-hydroxyglutarate-aldolase keto-deoxy-phosphogluconate aldolase [Lapidilactobacillus concavus DSM 17758]GEL13177.1 2-dehydro-3-deoxy-phosphogluconate aldolase [Lapidilactobacillus concavus]